MCVCARARPCAYAHYIITESCMYIKCSYIMTNFAYGLPNCACLLNTQGVKFVAALLKDGTVSPRAGEQYKLPTHWVNACWEKLGHKGKKMKRAGAYRNVRMCLLILYSETCNLIPL